MKARVTLSCLLVTLFLFGAAQIAQADLLIQTVGNSTTTQNDFWIGNAGTATCMIFNNTVGAYNLTTVDFYLTSSANTAFTVRLMNTTYNGSAWNPSKLLASGSGFGANTPTGLKNATGFNYVLQPNIRYAVCFDPGDSNAVYYRVGESTGTDVAKYCLSPSPNVNNLSGCTQWGTFSSGGVTSIYLHTYGFLNGLFVEASNSVNGSLINGLCVAATGATTQNQCNSTGASVLFTANGTYNVTAYSIGVGDNVTQTYFNRTVNNITVATSAVLIINTSQALLNVTAYTAYYNTSITTFNVTNGLAFNMTTTNSTLIAANNGTNNIRVDVAGNTSLNFSVIVQQLVVPFAATGFYDSVLNSSGGGVPVLSGLTCSDCNPPGNTSPYVTSDTTPTFRFATNVNANCRVGNTDVNYTTMGGTRQCMGGEGLTMHTCTLTSQDALSPSSGVMYIACKNTNDSSEPVKSSTGPLQITGIATTNATAEDYGIMQSVVWPQATVYQNQQVYLRDLNNNQKLATVDRVVVYGNQRWLIDYDNGTPLGLFNITPVVYSLDMTNLTLLQIESTVTSFINATKN